MPKRALVLVPMVAALCPMFALSSSALAQGSPAASQYEPCIPEAGVACAQSIEDGVQDIAGNTEQGADAVNDAMDGAAEASAPPETALPADTGASPDSASLAGVTGGGTDGESLDSITALPETGGVPLLGLCVGVALVGCGLLLRLVAAR